MARVKVRCRNKDEFWKIIEIARKEGYSWTGYEDIERYEPKINYPFNIVFAKSIYWAFAEKASEACTAQDFINDYNIDHAELFGISQKVKNEIILDFMAKWREIRIGCLGRSCTDCPFCKDTEDLHCRMDDTENIVDDEAFNDAVKLLIDVVFSGNQHTIPGKHKEEAAKEIRLVFESVCKGMDVLREALETAARVLEKKGKE